MNLLETISKILFLTRLELVKLVKQKLMLISGGILVFYTALNCLGFYMHRLKTSSRNFEGQLMADLLNGQAFALYALAPIIYLVMPMVIAIITALNFAGEIHNRQMRMVLTRPVPRWSVYMAKFTSINIFSFIMLMILMVITFVVGAIIFGYEGDIIIECNLFLIPGRRHIMYESEVWPRLIAAYTLASFSTCYLISMFMMFSVFFKKVPHSIIVSLGIYYTSYIMNAVPLMKHIHRFLPTNHLFVWRLMVIKKIPWDRFWNDISIDMIYIVSFMTVGIVLFYMSDE